MSTRTLMEELRGQLTPGQRPARPARPPRPARAAPARPAPGPRVNRRSGGEVIEPPPPRAVKDAALLERLKQSTPARVGIGRSGLRYRTETLLQFQVDFAVAQAAVESQVPEGWSAQQGWEQLTTEATDPEQFLTRPDLGRRLDAESAARVQRCVMSPDVQIVVGDGLSAEAVVQNAPPMVQSLSDELNTQGRSIGTLLFVKHCRAKILDVVGQIVDARVGIILIGERPGLGTGDGMSAYLVWNPRAERTDAEKQAISNIHRRGVLPQDAGIHAARLIEAILTQHTSGVNLDVSGIELPQSERPRINQAHAEPLLGCGQSHGQQCPAAERGMPGDVCNRSSDRPCAVSRH